MDCSKGKLFWHCCLLIAWACWPHRPSFQATLVRLIDATAHGGHDDNKPDDVLKPENKARMASKAEQLSDNDIDSQIVRELKERYPEFTYVDCYVRCIGRFCMFDEIRATKKCRCWLREKGFRVLGGWPTAKNGTISRARKLDLWYATRPRQCRQL